MMKRCFAMLLCCLMLLSSAHAETVLRTRIDVYKTFTAAHPDVKVEQIEGYLEADVLLNKLITRSMDEDVFYTFSNDVNLANMIDKGYLLDLSFNETIREAVSRMHPVLRDYVSRDGAIYALPYNVGYRSEMVCNEAVWTELGYTREDVPKTYPDLLDFLESWVIRCEANDLPNTITGGHDESYNEYTYPTLFVWMLMDSWEQQKEYAGGPLRFNDPVLIDLLERTMQVCLEIYRYCEPSYRGERQSGRPLFEYANPHLNGTWAMLDDWMVDPRITRDQPTLILANILVDAAYAGTAEPELAAELIAAELQWLDDEAAWIGRTNICFLYADAEPLPNPHQAGELRSTRNYIAITEHRLAGDDTPLEEYLELTDSDYERPKAYDDYTAIGGYRDYAARLQDMIDRDVEDKLAELQATLSWAEENAWSFSPEDLAVYKEFAQTMLIRTPGAFRSSSDTWSNYYSLVDQYIHGLITAQQLVTQLDRIAEMVELENQ